MTGFKKRFKKEVAKAKPVFTKGRKMAIRLRENINDYFVEDARQARKMRPKTEKIRF